MIRALYGGSFDPVHAGHVAVADMLGQRRLAAAVHVVPATRSPLKTDAAEASGKHRLAMLRLAFADRPDVVIEDLELARGGPSFSVDTLAALHEAHPGDSWCLVVGADQARDFDRWRQVDRLLTLADVVVVARGPLDLASSLVCRCQVVTDFHHPASSTDLRRCLAAGLRPGSELMAPAVTGYIIRHGLYGWPDGGSEACPET